MPWKVDRNADGFVKTSEGHYRVVNEDGHLIAIVPAVDDPARDPAARAHIVATSPEFRSTVRQLLDFINLLQGKRGRDGSRWSSFDGVSLFGAIQLAKARLRKARGDGDGMPPPLNPDV